MAKLGTKKRPATGHVRTEERAMEVVALCKEHGWEVILKLEPDMPEDISEVERLLNPPKPLTVGQKVGRNDPCPCGSGKKFKKCCMGKRVIGIKGAFWIGLLAKADFQGFWFEMAEQKAHR